MFGNKGPNSSQYDFKGTTVPEPLFSSSLPPAPTSLLPPEQEAPSPEAVEPLAAHNPTRVEASQTSSRIKQMSSKVLNIEQLWLPKIQTTLNKTSKNWRRK